MAEDGPPSFHLPMTIDPLGFLSEKKSPVEACDGDGDEFDRQQQSAHDGVKCRWREDEMHAEKFGSLCRRGFPGWEEGREGQHRHHAVQSFVVQSTRW